MDRRTLLAIVLCFLIFLGWQKLVIEPSTPKSQTTAAHATRAETSGSVKSPQDTKSTIRQEPVKQASRPHETKSISTSTGTATIGDSAKFITGWDLKSYRLGMGQDAKPVGLESVTHQESQVELAFDSPDFAYLSTVQGQLESRNGEITWTYEDDRVRLRREFKVTPEQPYFDMLVSAEFKSAKPGYVFLSLAAKATTDDAEAQDRQFLYFSENALERENITDVSAVTQVKMPVKWIGATSRYFLLSIVDRGVNPTGLMQSLGAGSGRMSLVYPVSGNSVQVPVRVYFGPKDLDVLRAAEPTLDHAVDLGWFTVVAYPILKLMKWLYSFMHNYGLAIIVLTVFIKILTYPLTYKSMKSMKDMAKIQPQLQRLKEKYKDDREALNREMMTLMKTHGYNPVAGCFPILIQMPVFFALYRVLYSSIELYQAPFAFWIHDLAAKDPYYVTPVILTATMFFQQKLTPNTATDPVQKRMIQFMPIMFGAFMLALPSGLTIYMLTNAIASIIQQIILNKKLDITHATPITAGAR